MQISEKKLYDLVELLRDRYYEEESFLDDAKAILKELDITVAEDNEIRFELNILIGSEAMQSLEDISQALEETAKNVRDGKLSQTIRDINGNSVGIYTLKYDIWDIKNRAEESIFDEITIFGTREFSELEDSLYQGFNEMEIYLARKKVIYNAIEEALLFYQDEAGGSHDLAHLEGLEPKEILEGLPW